MTIKNRVPLVSIIIPAYNCGKTIADTLKSCIDQSYKNIEIIVVNDGSTDNTSFILEGYKTTIRIVNQQNKGLAAARNAGQAIANGSYIAWMDADDIARVDRIDIEVQVLNQFPSVVLVSSDFSAFLTGEPDFESSHIGTYYGSFRSRGGAAKLYRSNEQIQLNKNIDVEVWIGQQFENLIWGNFVHPPTVMTRKKILDEIGPCDTGIRSGSDYEYILRLSRVGEFAFVDAPLLRYRRSDQQMSGSFIHGETWSEYRHMLSKFKDLHPGFFERNHELYKKKLAFTYIMEARDVGFIDRGKGIKLLYSSLYEYFFPLDVIKTFLYINIPKFVFTSYRALKRFNKR